MDQFSQRKKIFFSPKAIQEVANVIDNKKLHMTIFHKKLSLK